MGHDLIASLDGNNFDTRDHLGEDLGQQGCVYVIWLDTEPPRSVGQKFNNLVETFQV